jgi:hypothetical protein
VNTADLRSRFGAPSRSADALLEPAHNSRVAIRVPAAGVDPRWGIDRSCRVGRSSGSSDHVDLRVRHASLPVAAVSHDGEKVESGISRAVVM